jgi:acyl-CoA synthetase (AMP-forming)/AMP-acid ligase II
MRPLTVGELYDRAVRHGGDRPALTQDGRSITYADLGRDALRLAAALQARGVVRHDRIAFLMANCIEYVACEYATARIGATRVPLATLLGSDDHVYMMNFARCRVLVYHRKFAAQVEQMLPRLESVELFICVGSAEDDLVTGHLHLAALIAAPWPAPAEVEVDPEDIAGIYFTGGTTGRPKGVLLSHRAWFHTYYAELLDFDLGWHEVFVIATPMTHAAGCLLLPVLLRQGRCVLLERFDPGLLLETMAAERATATLLVPTMIYLLLDHPGRDRHDLGSLRNVLYGAAAIAPERLEQALAAFGPVFTQFFGQTEAPMALTALPREAHLEPDPARRQVVLASAGRATYATTLRLVDDAGHDVPTGGEGELIARAPNVMSGYLDDPAATATALRDGWLYTGDVARLSPDGLVTIVDRKKDVIVSGGFNVYPREVEDALFEHPAVRHAAVVGAPHPKWGEEVRALVVLHDGARADERELIEFVRARKGGLHAPKSVEFTDAIPLTNLGKVDRKQIRARYWAGRDRRV